MYAGGQNFTSASGNEGANLRHYQTAQSEWLINDEGTKQPLVLLQATLRAAAAAAVDG